MTKTFFDRSVGSLSLDGFFILDLRHRTESFRGHPLSVRKEVTDNFRIVRTSGERTFFSEVERIKEETRENTVELV